MDLAFTPEELKFRDEVRAWVKDNLPADIAGKVHKAQRLSRDDMQRWSKILGKRAGWATAGPSSLAGRAGRRCKSICSRKNAPWPDRRASCRSAR